MLTSQLETRNLYFLKELPSNNPYNNRVSPAEILFGRKINTKIPDIKSDIYVNDNSILKKDNEGKQKMKNYFGKKHFLKPSEFKIGDRVLVKQEKKDKLTTPYIPKPLQIKNKKGSMIIVSDIHDQEITRNSSHFKKIGDS